MRMSGRNHRLDRLEQRYRPTCRTCGGWPVRVVIESLNGDHAEESMPRSGCPDCGTPVMHTIEILGAEGEGDPAPLNRTGW